MHKEDAHFCVSVADVVMPEDFPHVILPALYGPGE